jgi:hypothetical protein
VGSYFAATIPDSCDVSQVRRTPTPLRDEGTPLKRRFSLRKAAGGSNEDSEHIPKKLQEELPIQRFLLVRAE